MRERLIEYIDGLFSGAALNMRNAEIKEEILQNTLEHYDDLLSEGKSEQEAYDAVIQGIGDVRPLVEPDGSAVSAEAAPESQPSAPETAADETHPGLRGAVGGIWMLFTALYLLISFTTHAWHITWILFLIAPAVINILNAVLDAKSRPGSGRGAAIAALWLLTTALYFVLSFATGAWRLTWILFLIAGAATGLVSAIYDWKK